MQHPIDVVAVTVTYNSAALLPEFLESLPAGLEGLSWHLVVVDNASHDGSAALARSLMPDCSVVTIGYNAGYAAGINAGVAAAPPHRAILVLNPDVRLEHGCARHLLDALEHRGIGIAVPRLADGSGELHFSMRREPTLLRTLGEVVLGARHAGRWHALGEIVVDPRLYDAKRTTDWAEGSTQLISLRCWDACGPWDESFFLYSEETEFGLRARDVGYRTLYVPEARGTHLQGGSQTTEALWALLVTNQVRLYCRRHGEIAGALFWLLVTLREVRRAVMGKRVSRAALTALTSRRRMREKPSARWIADFQRGV